MFAENGAILYGIDLTPRAIKNTNIRFNNLKLNSNLSVGDAENLSFEDSYLDIVYSWGVIHPRLIPKKQFQKYLGFKAGGEARIMIYIKWSFIGLMLYIRYGLLRFKIFSSLDYLYANYLESFGTKAYTTENARAMFSKFTSCNIETVLSHGDLLESSAGQRHRGFLLSFAKKIWPRKFIRKYFSNFGLFMLIKATSQIEVFT